MSSPIDFPAAHLFTHDAMNTTFTLRFRGVDATAAAGMARQCGDLIDVLESQLSRYHEGSDISRINHLAAGETLYLSEACHQCLLQALDGYVRTGGLFDITLGTRIARQKAGGGGPLPELVGRLTIHPDVPAVTCDAAGRELDLGGIGKGFALDQLKQLLLDWGARDVLLTAGASSMLAFGPTRWPIDLATANTAERVYLTNQALSASGSDIQGSHIVHPAGEEAMPAVPNKRVWVLAETAVLAEVWSTALMLVAADELAEVIAGCDEVTAAYAGNDERVEAIRPWRDG